jgi:dTDP-glucose pyrophosphorylase/CBS domain-containing protein
MMNPSDIPRISVRATDTLYDVVKSIDVSARLGISLVIDDRNRLIATITDGDIRRAIVAGFRMDNTVADILPMKERSPHPTPVVAPIGTRSEGLLAVMQSQSVRQVPLVDESGMVTDIVLLNDLIRPAELPVEALIMAGGPGTRLRPLTIETPKPMLTLGGRPLLERIIRQLRDAGVLTIYISTHYKSEKIEEYFGDGSAFGVRISYCQEDPPLGTGGALGLIPTPQRPLLVVNGDILTGVDFRVLVEHHQQRKPMMTVGVGSFDFEVPYGVVKCDGEDVKGLVEKPRYSFLINAGIYLIEPAVFRYVSKGKRFNMTDLIQQLVRANEKVVRYQINEYWADIGSHSDYERAQKDVQDGLLGNGQA